MLWRVALGGLGLRMLYFAVSRRKPRTNFSRIVVKRPHTAAVSNLAIFVNDVEAFRPGRIGIVGGVVHGIYPEGKRIVEASCEIIGNRQAVGKIARLRVADVVLHVGLHLPLIGRMRFADVDGEKISMCLVIVKDLHDVADLATEGRSGKAAEDQHQRLSGRPFADMERVRTV